MPGALLAEAFGETMSLDQKKGILAQTVRLLKALYDYLFPESIEGCGGVTSNGSGAIISAHIIGAGPWSFP